MPVTFLFIRHGEAEHNVDFHQIGESAFLDEKNKDAPLTPKGMNQARDLANILSKFKIRDIWSSPSTRTIQTALEVFEETSANKIYLHDNLLEYHVEGHVCNLRKPTKELELYFLGLIKTKFLPEFPPEWTNTENSTAVYYRMLSVVMILNEMYKEHSDCYVAIVSHKNAISTLTRKSLSNCEFVAMTLNEILNPSDE